jgi:mannose-6-phosphate isomerase-like protein (cupin superfamily)
MNCRKVQSVRHDAAAARDRAASGTQTSVVRMDVKKGTYTETRRHETECLVIVLEGAWRIHLRDRALTIQKNEMARIPARHEHFMEALADTVALSISDSAHEWTESSPFVQEDPDQYLWGV